MSPRQTAPGGTPGPRVHWPRTLAARRQSTLDASHLRFRRTAARAGVLHCFVLDCSGSMAHGEPLALAKGVLARLVERAYQARADVALVCFAGQQAEVRLAPSRARPWNDDWIRPIAGGGGTPLALGVARADQLLARHARRWPAQQRWLWLLTDGRSPEAPARPAWADHATIVDVERHAQPLGRCRQIAAAWDADYRTAESLAQGR
ncbi:vWA domain-containing protein [Cupriavidus pauculus]|uniref:vWA domain-containing protein n=1 Tax=Cupriavidus pauculus TaxID=82633 RepID=UPI0020A53867|nr:VWA domain-containing protein [Cupriavidus pauculus]